MHVRGRSIVQVADDDVSNFEETYTSMAPTLSSSPPRHGPLPAALEEPFVGFEYGRDPTTPLHPPVVLETHPRAGAPPPRSTSGNLRPPSASLVAPKSPRSSNMQLAPTSSPPIAVSGEALWDRRRQAVSRLDLDGATSSR